MATIDLGKLGFVNKGTYSSSTSYEKNDLVQYTDSGILSTYLYINAAAATGQTPSTSGTVNGTYWAFFAKGVADAIAGAGNNKVLVTNSSGNLAPVSIGSAGQVLKTNSSANGFEFAADDGGTVKQMVTARDTTGYSVSVAGGNTNVTAISILGTITPSSTSSKIVVNWCIPQIDGDTDGPSGTFLRVYRKIGSGSYAELTEVNGVNASGSSHNCYFSNYPMDGDENRAMGSGFSGVFYDTTHNSTSALTYRMYIGCGDSGSRTYTANRTRSGPGSASHQGSTATHAILMEI